MRVAIVCVAGLLLLTMGAAIVLAPVTLPALWFARRPPAGRATRGLGAAVAGLTAAEVVWFAVYSAWGEPKPAIWLVPLLGGVAVAAAYGSRR